MQARGRGVALGDQDFGAWAELADDVEGAGLAGALFEALGTALTGRDRLERPKLSIDVASWHDKHIAVETNAEGFDALAIQVGVGAVVRGFGQLVPACGNPVGGFPMLLDQVGGAALTGKLNLSREGPTLVARQLRSLGSPSFFVPGAKVLDVPARPAVQEADVGAVLGAGLAVYYRQTMERSVHDRIAFEQKAGELDGFGEVGPGLAFIRHGRSRKMWRGKQERAGNTLRRRALTRARRRA